MNTKRVERESAIDRLRADMANWETDMANWKTDMAKNGRDNTRWIIGSMVAMTSLVIALIRL